MDKHNSTQSKKSPTVGTLTNPKGWTEEEQRLIDNNAMDMDLFCDRIFEQLENSPALIKPAQLTLVEEMIRTDAVRRAALKIATESGRRFVKRIEQDREFAVITAHVASKLKDAVARYQQLSELLSQVNTRIEIALCGREDMDSVISEAEAM